MISSTLLRVGATAGVALCATVGVSQAQINNASFEVLGSNPPVFLDWQEFNNVGTNLFRQNDIPFDGSFHVEMRGPGFDDGMGNNVQGDTVMVQSIPANPGERWEASVYATHPFFDPIVGIDAAFLSLEYRDATDTIISNAAVNCVTAGTATDTWQQYSVAANAPAGTASVAIVLGVFQSDQAIRGGAAYFDLAGLQMVPPPTGLSNKDFETGLGDWGSFGNVFADGQLTNSGTGAAKMFGDFFNPFNVAGVFQSLPAQPGEVWDASCFAGTVSDDLMAPGNRGFMNMEFKTSTGDIIAIVSVDTATNAGPVDTMSQFTSQLVAPPGTAEVTLLLAHLQDDMFGGGAIWYDDACMETLSTQPQAGLYNPGFEIASFGALYPAGGWLSFNNTAAEQNIQQSELMPESGTNSLLMFGAFQELEPGVPAASDSGVLQSLPAQPGECWTASVSAKVNEALDLGNSAFMSLIFLDGSGGILQDNGLTILDDTSAVGAYAPFSVSAEAPAGTASAQIVLGFSQSDAKMRGGSVLFDNAALAATPGDCEKTVECPGDINTTGTTNGVPDGQTNLSDLQFFLTNWQNDLGMTPGSIADVNTTGTTNGMPDGEVNLSDLQFYLTQWQSGLAVCP